MMLAQDNDEHIVPGVLRPRFRKLVSALVAGDFEFTSHELSNVSPLDMRLVRLVADEITAYGDDLAPLNDEVWEQSVYRWMDGYWEFLVDLSTTRQAVSDLVLHAKLFGDQDGLIEVWSVRVP